MLRLHRVATRFRQTGIIQPLITGKLPQIIREVVLWVTNGYLLQNAAHKQCLILRILQHGHPTAGIPIIVQQGQPSIGLSIAQVV